MNWLQRTLPPWFQRHLSLTSLFLCHASQHAFERSLIQLQQKEKIVSIFKKVVILPSPVRVYIPGLSNSEHSGKARHGRLPLPSCVAPLPRPRRQISVQRAGLQYSQLCAPYENIHQVFVGKPDPQTELMSIISV